MAFRVVARIRGSKWVQAQLAGNAGMCFPENPENRRIRELQFMVPEFVARTGGSKWLSALPTSVSRGA